MTDPDTRRAAWIATLVAVPVAVVAGVVLWPRSVDSPAPRPSTPPAPTSSASVEARELSTRAETICRGLIARLPGTVAELPRRPVASGPEQNAAYGTVVLRCGVAPVKLPKTSTATVYPLSKVCWFPRTTGKETVWTTLDREVPVSVTVTGPADETGQMAAAFSPYVVKVPAGGDPPSGCRP